MNAVVAVLVAVAVGVAIGIRIAGYGTGQMLTIVRALLTCSPLSTMRIHRTLGIPIPTVHKAVDGLERWGIVTTYLDDSSRLERSGHPDRMVELAGMHE